MKKLIVPIIIILVIVIAFNYFSKNSSINSNNDVQPVEKKLEEKEETEEVVGYMDVTAPEAKKLIDENPDLIIIDVSPKYEEGHLPGAINYYIGDGTLENAVPTLDKEAMYLVYCHVDSASIPGAQRLIDEGIKNVYRLQGNYAAWVNAGYPIEK